MTTLYAHIGAEGAPKGANSVPRLGSKPLDSTGNGGHIETMADHVSERLEMRRRWGTAGDLAFGRRLGETSKTVRFPLGIASDTSLATTLVVAGRQR